MERRIINGNDYLVYSVDEDTSLDMVSINMLEHNNIKGLMPFKFIRQEHDEFLRFGFTRDDSLSQWTMDKRGKNEVIALINSIIAVYEELTAYLMPKEHLYTEMDDIAVIDGKCVMAYLPVKDEEFDNILTLIQRVLSQVRYPMDEDYAYLFDLQNAFNRGEIRNVQDMKKWIRIAVGELVEDDNNSQEAESYQGSAQVIKPYYEEPEEKTNNSSDDDRTKAIIPENTKAQKKEAVDDIFAEFGLPVAQKQEKANPKKEKKEKEKKEKEKKEHTPLFGKKNKEVNVAPIEEVVAPVDNGPKKEIINDLSRGNSTVLIGGNNVADASSLVPVLFREKNKQGYSIKNNSCVVGSGKAADISISDNPAISRTHAKITCQNGDYYIEDLGSTNGSCVNGETLMPNAPYLLRDMARIKLSDETFIFNLRR